MSNPAQLGFSLERMLRLIEESATSSGKRAASLVMNDFTQALEEAIAAHEAKRRGVHGTGPFYVAKTKNSSQRISWDEITNKPVLLDTEPEDLILNAEQIATGTLEMQRLPVASPGEHNADKLVTANDPRLNDTQWTMEVGVPLQTGDFVASYDDAGTGKLMPASAAAWETLAIGFVSQAWGVGDEAVVYPVGINDWTFIYGLTVANMGDTIFLNTNGKATLNPGGVSFLQPLGTIIRVVGTNLASVMVRYEFRIEFEG